MSYDEYADEAAYAEQQAAYAAEMEAQLEDEYQREAEAAQERAFQEYADTLCAGCRHPRHEHTDGGIEYRLRTGMPCIARDVDVTDEDRTVECMCLGWWEPGTDCPYDATEVSGRVFEKLSNIGKGSYQLGKEMTDEMVGEVTERMRDRFGTNEPATEKDGILTCSCGSERWTTDVVIEHGSVTEYGSIRCAKCSRGRKGTFEIRRSDIERYGLGEVHRSEVEEDNDD